MCIQTSTKGKTEQSLCVPQYFAWVNHGNDGSSESQTLKNLEFFAYLKREFGMQLEIYALDAGNFDSPMEHYYDPENPMAKQNFPNWLRPIADRAAELGIRLGMWCGPDGFGQTPQEEMRRFEQVVSLCRDYHVALLKFDLVCGPLRTEKQEIFEKMIAECRKYCPELIVLNHRLELGDAQKYATTFLWGGQETYIDVLIQNSRTAPHHRQCALERGLVPGLQRLTEDHGVCLSSCLDFFEDELVLQAFNRALILSPEIYGTPAFLRDDELPRLARIFNLSKKYADLLVHGMELDSSYGDYAVSRGDGKTRILTFMNNSWEPLNICVHLSRDIGLDECEIVSVLQYHPTQRVLGDFKYGDSVTVTVDPFRACMIVAGQIRDEILIDNCDYEVISDMDGQAKINIVRGDKIRLRNPERYAAAEVDGAKVDLSSEISINADAYLYSPEKLGQLAGCAVPADVERLYEANCFDIDNDSLERRAVRRSGESNIEQVRAVREAFFSQLAYKIRGCDSGAMFDNDPDTFFDSITRSSGQRIQGGCLRIDLAQAYDVDEMTVEYFDDPQENEYMGGNILPQSGTFSADLQNWSSFEITGTEIVGEASAPIALQTVERVAYVPGKRKKATYRLSGSVRYIRLPQPMDRIYAVRFYKSGQEISVSAPKANNMMAPYEAKAPRAALSGQVRLPKYKSGSYLSIACNGLHGVEGVYCMGKYKDTVLTCPDRAPSYPANFWGHWVGASHINYTYYMPLPDGLQGEEITLYALVCKDGDEKFGVDVYLCSPNDEKHGKTLLLK